MGGIMQQVFGRGLVDADMAAVQQSGGQRWPDEKYVQSISRMRSLLTYVSETKDETRRMFALRQVTRVLRNPQASTELRFLCAEKLLELLPSVIESKQYQLASKLEIFAAVGATKDHRFLPQLILLLNDPGNLIRGQAARSLGEIGDPRAVQPLANTLRSDQFAIMSH